VRLVDYDKPFQASYSLAILKMFPIDDLKQYLLIALRSPALVRQLDKAVRASSQPDVGLKHIRGLLVPLPPLEEHKEIVHRAMILLQLADSIDRQVSAAAARVDKFTQSILAKAFRGELVPTEAELARRQGRDYEPASVLLERIRAERASQVNSRSSGHRRAGPSKNRLARAKGKQEPLVYVIEIHIRSVRIRQSHRDKFSLPARQRRRQRENVSKESTKK
jgi:hypothetical protein